MRDVDTQIDVFDATVGSLLLVSLDCVHLPNQTVFEIIQRHPSDNVLTLRLRVTGYSEDIRITDTITDLVRVIEDPNLSPPLISMTTNTRSQYFSGSVILCSTQNASYWVQRRSNNSNCCNQ